MFSASTDNHIRLLIFLVSMVSLLSGGCTALQPFPNVARGGDTIALALGSAQDMTRANTSATFTSDTDGVPIDITSNIRSIFKLYADKASKLNEYGSMTSSLVDSSKHSPWVTIAVVDLPEGLAIGTGKLHFNTTANYPDIGSHINNIDLGLEIIPGIGSSNSFDYEFGIGAEQSGDLSLLESQTRAEFGPAIPSTNCPCPDYAAIEIKANIPTSIGTLPLNFVRIIAEDLHVSTGSAKNMLYGVSADGQILTVTFISQEARLKYYEAQFSLIPHSSISFSGAPTIHSVRYFDIDGNEVAGPVSDYNVILK